MVVAESIKPGVTNAPAKSNTSVPLSTLRSSPIAAIRPATICTSRMTPCPLAPETSVAFF